MRRRRRLGDGLAIPARNLLAHVLNDLPAPRLAFERFRHSLRELAQVRAAAFAAGARRWIDDALAGQIFRQRPARRLDPSRASLFASREQRFQPWSLPRPGSPRDRGWRARAVRRCACRAQTIARTFLAATWRA